MRKLALALGFLLVFAAAGWSALWFYAAHEAGVQLDGWLKAEDTQGRDWTCPGRAIGGYPFTLTIACAKPTFTGRAPGQTVRAGVAALQADISIAHPQKLVVALRGPLAYVSSDGAANLTATWSALAVDIDGLPGPTGLDIHAADIAYDGTFGDSQRQVGKAGAVDAHVAVAPDMESAYDLTIAAGGAAVPALDDLLGDKAPVDLDAKGRLMHVDLDDPRTPAEAVEQWRQAGGTFVLGPSTITRGPARIAGSGTLRLDDAHRLQGRLDASFVGLEPILKRYGIDTNLAAAGSLLSTLFGGKPQAPTAPGALNLPISFQNGYLGVGPIRTQVALQPLY